MFSVAIALAGLGLGPVILTAQAAEAGSSSPNVAVESTILVLDESRVSRIGLSALHVGTAAAAAPVSAGHGAGNLRVGTRIGDLTVSVFLDLVRRERAVRRESTQSVLTVSGSAAEVSSQQTLIGTYGQQASAGRTLWLEPTALPGGDIRLRVWTAFGDVRQGPFGSVWEDVPVEARAEIVVPQGTPVVIATTDHTTDRSERGMVGRGSSNSSTRAWVIVRARVMGEGEGLARPPGLSRE